MKRIVLEGKEDRKGFALNHNGVTLFAEVARDVDGRLRITEPRLLNGAQTVTTFARFLKSNDEIQPHLHALHTRRTASQLVQEWLVHHLALSL